MVPLILTATITEELVMFQKLCKTSHLSLKQPFEFGIRFGILSLVLLSLCYRRGSEK